MRAHLNYFMNIHKIMKISGYKVNYKAAKYWNSLFEYFKSITDLKEFKTKI